MPEIWMQIKASGMPFWFCVFPLITYSIFESRWKMGYYRVTQDDIQEISKNEPNEASERNG